MNADRYSRQVLFPEIGEAGQDRLRKARVTLVGCGALGTVQASTLVRAGVGRLRICDRDYIEVDNLQRQVLFDEDDIASGLPKAEAARRKLARINSEVHVEAVVAHVDAGNLPTLTADADLVLDGTDNFETRFLINDWAIKTGKPWIYGAVIGASGLCMAILPGQTPCLRCIFEEAPPPELNPTCDTAGVIGPAVNIVASFQVAEALKMLTGRTEAVNRHLMSIDVWTGRLINLNVKKPSSPARCPCCDERRFDYLDGDALGASTVLCGRNAVQITRPGRSKIDFDSIAAKLRPVAHDVMVNAFMLRARLNEIDLTLFADGRAIMKGTKDAAAAQTLYAKYIGA